MKFIIPTLLASSVLCNAATFSVQNIGGLKDALRKAKANGPSVDTINFNGNWQDQWGGSIVVNTPVTIDGLNNQRTKIRNNSNQAIFRVFSGGVTIKNISLLDGRGGSAKSGISVGGTYWGLSVSGCIFNGNSYGIENFGSKSVPKNVWIIGNKFMNHSGYALNFIRDSGSPEGKKWPLDGGVFEFRNNTVDSAGGGCLVDNGNDGADWVNGRALGKGDNNYIGSAQSPYPTKYKPWSKISNNVIRGVRNFGIGLAKVDDIDVTGNTVAMANERSYGAAIQLEHRTRNCIVENNTVNLWGQNQTSKIGISLTPFAHRKSHSYGCSKITVKGNRFNGNGAGIGFGAYSFTDIAFFQNNLYNMAGIQVSNWKPGNVGGANWFSQNWGNTGIAAWRQGKIPAEGVIRREGK